MLSISKILLPVDFQDTSKRVIQQAAVLSRRFQSEVVLLHVVTPLSYSAGSLEGSYVPSSLDDLLKQLINSAQNKLNQFLAHEFDGLAIKRILLEGDPALTIVQTARDEKADLIVMPTHGYGAFRRYLLGSVTAKVLHDSECPVWTGAHLEEEPAREFAIRNVLCALDLSTHSHKTLECASQLAAKFGARLTIAHITAGGNAQVPDVRHSNPKWKEELISSATQQIAKLQEESGTKAEVFIESGDVPALLSQAAKQTESDVLVIGRPPHGRLRATGYGIIRELHIPILSV